MNSSDPSLLANMDPPGHTRLRRLLSGAFSLSRIRELNDWVVGLVDELLDDMIERGTPGDFYEAVARGLPNAVVTGILGGATERYPALPRLDRSDAGSEYLS